MPEKTKHSNPYHPDIWLFLILIPLISAFNYYLTYTHIQLNGYLLLTFTLDTAEGYLAWWGIRSYILFLDKKLPYETGPVKRLGIQLSGTIIIGLFIIISLTEIVSWIARGKPAALNFYTIDIFIISIWFFVINGIYAGLFFYNQWQSAEEKRREENRIRAGGLLVNQGKQELLLDFKLLSGLYVDGEYVAACDTSGKRYYLNQSLDKIELKLPATYFFRFNRQYILHRQQVTGFKRDENGKILVLLKPSENFPPEIGVSRTRAPAFKDWFRPE